MMERHSFFTRSAVVFEEVPDTGKGDIATFGTSDGWDCAILQHDYECG